MPEPMLEVALRAAVLHDADGRTLHTLGDLVDSLPPDMREYIKHKTDQQLAKIRQMMTEEGFKPTSHPATRATTRPNEDL